MPVFRGPNAIRPKFQKAENGQAQRGMGERDLVRVLSRRYDLSERQVWRILKQSWTVDAPEVAQ